MKYLMMFAIQLVVTTAAVIVVNRKLMLHNIAFRNQLGVYFRTVDKKKIKSQIRDRDRRLWLMLKKLLDDWTDYLVIVKPEAVIKGERRRFNRFWIKKSRAKGKVGRPRIAEQHIEFIRRISGDHPEMGLQKIADELYLKFGIKHSPETIRKYRLPRRYPRGDQTWRTFVKNHAKEIFACDFLTQHTVALRVFYIFVVMEVGSRRIIHFNASEHPSLDWVKQQLREATSGVVPRFLIHDNDGVFGQFAHKNRPWTIDRKTSHRRRFRCRLDQWLYECLNITGIPTPYAAPNANPHIERWNWTLSEEALCHFVFLGGNHLLKTIRKYITYYNRARPSQAIHAIPDPYPELMKLPPEKGKLVALPVLGGLHHDYRLVA
ncbi:MAG: transposase [Proteobacteria bacterium]|nr:transposase [Pseudomonadota bacterium]